MSVCLPASCDVLFLQKKLVVVVQLPIV